MLGYFPKPLPDELFNSICARFADHMGLTHSRQVCKWLFDNHNVAPVAGFPSYIDKLVEQLPVGYCYTADDMISKHTLLPMFRPFLLQNRYNQICTEMRNISGNRTFGRLALGSSGIPQLKWLRYCPVCAESDSRKYGECYWHRLHQVQGVEICPEHLVFLEDSQVYVQNGALNNIFLSAERTLKAVEPRSSLLTPYHTVFYQLAVDMGILLNDHLGFLDDNERQQRFLMLLGEKGLLTTTDKIRNEDLLSQLTQYYPSELLNRLHCETERSRYKFASWPCRLPRKQLKLQHPLYHLLLIHFLGRTVSDFFQMSIVSTPFGTGPWPCLNPVCKHYKTFSITQCHVIRSRNRPPAGQFTCECGFTYTRSGPDRSNTDIYKIGRVLERGDLWINALRDLFQEPTMTYSLAASKLGVGITNVKRLLSLYHPELLELRMREDFNEVRQRYRNQWLHVLVEFPQAKVSELKQKLPQAYLWLYITDNCWLLEHRPPTKNKVSSVAKRQLLRPMQPVVDWRQRDEETARLVKDTAEKLRNFTQRPKRITRGAIRRESKLPFIRSESLKKMPLTKQSLVEVIETYLEFAVRRIHWYVQQYKSKGIYPERWRIIQEASLKKYLHEPLIQEAINEALSKLIPL